MLEAYIGEITMFAGDFAPKDWAFCEGQSIPVRQNTTLYSVIGNTYGGDATNFNLPHLGLRLPLGFGNGPGLTPRPIGESGGSPTYSLNLNNMPLHTHTLFGVTNKPTSNSPVNAFLGSNPTRTTAKFKSGVEPLPPIVALDAMSIKATGQGTPISNDQPALTIRFIICVTGGEYPNRP
ncbi:MAG: phage tail protein [Sphingobacteriales bacterium]|nr:MAG: phage tail protein [Sphingobacteriales bacterium]